MPRPYPELTGPTKALATFPGWSDPPEGGTGYIWFNAPIEIGGIVEPGFVLHGGCYIDKPTANISFELRLSRTPGRAIIPLEPFDWRSLQGGHANKRNRGGDGSYVSPTHLHAFELNWLPTSGRMRRGNLPLAQDIPDQLNDFAEVLAFVGNRFRINNIGLVQEPKWEYELRLGE